jgi:hypothetical protein
MANTGGNMGGSKRSPENNMEIAVIARKRVRGMLQVLDKIAKDEKQPASARVSAAKAMIATAQLRPEQVKDLSDEQLRVLAEKIVKSQAETRADARKILEENTDLQDGGDNLQ